MRRRQFLSAIGGFAFAVPFVARAQQADKPRRVAVIYATTADDPEARARMAVFRKSLADLGWIEGAGIQIDLRMPSASEEIQKSIGELVANKPDVIITTGNTTVAPLMRA